MAKKKKGNKNDARGYTTKIPSSVVVGKSNTFLQLSKPANDEISSLLDRLKELLSLSTTSNYKREPISISLQDKKQIKRIETLNEQLQGYGFQDDDILRVFCAICNGEAVPWFLQRTKNAFQNEQQVSPFDLEMALDWLCYHVDSQDLPPLFRQDTTHHDASTDSNMGISVDKGQPRADFSHKWATANDSMKNDVHDKAEETMLIQQTKSISFKDHDQVYCNSDNNQEQKRRIVAQYAYIEEEVEVESESEEYGNQDDYDMNTNEIQNSSGNPTQNSPQNQTIQEKSVEEMRLEKLEQQIKENHATLKDDVSCYMMSKYEIKELKATLKKNEQVAKSLRSKIEKMKQKQALENSYSHHEASVPDDNMDEEEEFGSNIFEMPSAVGEDVDQTVRIPTRCANIRKWSGTTPKDLLLDICRKNQYPSPKFTKIPNTVFGCSLWIQLPSRELSFQDEGPFESFQDAQHFVACEALYYLEPDKPLYQLLPPVFQDIWKSWLREKHDEQIAVIESKEEERDRKVAALIQRIQDHTATSTDGAGIPNESKRDDPVKDWDEESLGTESDDMQNKMQSDEQIQNKIGDRLRKDFQARQNRDNYTKLLKDRTQLPIFEYRNLILEAVERNNVTILCAETGAGKTTQAPQFILEDALLSGYGGKINMICTQPRRIAAVSVAERVAEEMSYDIGSLIGYQIRGETKVSRKTVLSFCTTGVLLRRLQDDPTLSGVSHILIDECHERQWQIDFLIIALRRLLLTSRMDLKVILMSATIDTKLFLNFFDGFRVQLLQIPGRTFPVTNYYLEDVLEATGHVIEENSCFTLNGNYYTENESSLWVTTKGGGRERAIMDSSSGIFEMSGMYSDYSFSTRRSMEIVDEKKINYDLIEDLLIMLLNKRQMNTSIVAPNGDGGMDTRMDDGSVLIFLPGIGEIRALHQRLSTSKIFGNNGQFNIISMHSSISSKEQKRAFVPQKMGCKIILATNICEASLTIPDCVVVIDTGLERSIKQNNRTSTPTLVTDWCSKASAKQRAGRAGRVRSGVCFKLYSSNTATKIMRNQSVPELQRIPLEEVCLTILSGHLSDNCLDFLIQAPQPPSSDAVHNALKVLEDVGAIEPLIGEKAHSRTEIITPLGSHLARLPIHVRLGKMLIFGCLFKTLDKVLTIVSCLSASKSIFSLSMEMNFESEAARKSFRHPTCDFLTFCNIWDAYRNASNKSQFCSKKYLNISTLMEISDLRKLYVEQLKLIGFISETISENNLVSSDVNIHGRNDAVINAVITAGLYPNCAHRVKESNGSYKVFNRNEQLCFHRSSVFYESKVPREWVVYHEKFATHKTYISNASGVSSYGLILFGNTLSIQYTSRSVIIDKWIELRIPAQLAVFFREVRIGISVILENMLTMGNHTEKDTILDSIVRLLELEEASSNKSN